jgi:hypothetical protein
MVLCWEDINTCSVSQIFVLKTMNFCIMKQSANQSLNGSLLGRYQHLFGVADFRPEDDEFLHNKQSANQLLNGSLL